MLFDAGEDACPTLWASDTEGQSSKFDLDPELTNWLLEALHFIGKSQSEKAGAGQPAPRSESDSEGGDKPQPEAEGRSR